MGNLQADYDSLMLELGGQDIVLDKPIRFRLTPHSLDVFISDLPMNKNIEEFGDAKFTVLQKLRLLKFNKSNTKMENGKIIEGTNESSELAGTGEGIQLGCSPVEEARYQEREQQSDDSETVRPLNFGEAVESLKKGYMVSREGWNGKGMYLVLINSGDYGINGSFIKLWKDMREGQEKINDTDCHTLLPWIGMKTADDKFVPWLASQTDILSEDWGIVNI